MLHTIPSRQKSEEKKEKGKLVKKRISLSAYHLPCASIWSSLPSPLYIHRSWFAISTLLCSHACACNSLVYSYSSYPNKTNAIRRRERKQEKHYKETHFGFRRCAVLFLTDEMLYEREEIHLQDFSFLSFFCSSVPQTQEEGGLPVLDPIEDMHIAEPELKVCRASLQLLKKSTEERKKKKWRRRRGSLYFFLLASRGECEESVLLCSISSPFFRSSPAEFTRLR